MSFARKIATVGGGTLASRLLAYARDAGIAAWLGASGPSEAFFAVFQLVNFFRRLLAEGALNGAFVPIWLKLAAKDEALADRFTRRALVSLGCIAGIVTLTIFLFAPLLIAALAPGFDAELHATATVFLRIVAPYVCLAALVAVLAAALNAAGRVAAVAFGTVIFNIVMLFALLFTWNAHLAKLEVALWLCDAVVVAVILQLAIAATAWLAGGHRFRSARLHTPDEIRPLLFRTVPGLIATGIPQLKLIAGTAIASASPAAVAWLYYANRLYELPLGVASIAIAAVVVPQIAAGVHAGEAQADTAAQSRAYEVALGLALPAATGFAVLASEIAGGLFEHGAFGARDTTAVAAALAAICAGLPGHVLEKTFGAVCFAREDTRTPMLTSLCGLAAAIALGLLLFPHYGHVGVAAAVALSGWIGGGLLGLVLLRRGRLRLDDVARMRLPRILLATATMGLCVEGARTLGHRLLPQATVGWEGRLVLLIALVLLGLAVYGLALRVLGVISGKALLAAIRNPT